MEAKYEGYIFQRALPHLEGDKRCSYPKEASAGAAAEVCESVSITLSLCALGEPSWGFKSVLAKLLDDLIAHGPILTKF